RPRPRRALHSFPTRRSSDLRGERAEREERGERGKRTEAAESTAAPLTNPIPAPPAPAASAPPISSPPPDSIGRNPNGIFAGDGTDRKSTRLNSSHVSISYAV